MMIYQADKVRVGLFSVSIWQLVTDAISHENIKTLAEGCEQKCQETDDFTAVRILDFFIQQMPTATLIQVADQDNQGLAANKD